MTNDYKDWLTKDVQPEHAAAKLHGFAFWKNWWHYNWRIVLAVIAGAVILWQIFAGMLGIGQVKPDYQIAYVGSTELPADTVEAITKAFSSLGEDENGDGEVLVELHQYVLPDGDENAETRYAASVQLTADLSDGESYFLLLEDPDSFQQEFAALAFLDGSCPEDDDPRGLDKVYLWANCPVLSSLDLGGYSQNILGEIFEGDDQELLSDLYFGRRCFYPESNNTVENIEGCAALWDTLVSGAAQ